MDKVISYYTTFAEREWTRLDREPLEFQVNWHYITKHLPPGGNVLDNGAGPGKYAMALARNGYQVTLTDLTPSFVELAKQKATDFGLLDRFTGFHTADARDLHLFSDEAFDATLMLGPLYHLQAEEDRKRAVTELHRVTKTDGVVFVAFRSRTNHIMQSLMQPENWKPHDSANAIHSFWQSGIFDHSHEGRFTGAYFFPLEAITPFMENQGFTTIGLYGSTNIRAVLTPEQWQYWRERGEEEQLTKLLIELAADPSILGISSHLLYIGKKNKKMPQ